MRSDSAVDEVLRVRKIDDDEREWREIYETTGRDIRDAEARTRRGDLVVPKLMWSMRG